MQKFCQPAGYRINILYTVNFVHVAPYIVAGSGRVTVEADQRLVAAYPDQHRLFF